MQYMEVTHPEERVIVFGSENLGDEGSALR
jgi:hypothetical protein